MEWNDGTKKRVLSKVWVSHSFQVKLQVIKASQVSLLGAWDSDVFHFSKLIQTKEVFNKMENL